MANKKIYILGWAVGLLGLAAGLAIKGGFLIEKICIIPCPIFERFGIYCPGCGGTRAILSMFEGNFVQSFLYHPMVLYVAVLYILIMASYTIHLLSHKRIGYIRISYPLVLSVLVILILQWVVKMFLQLNCGYEIM